MTEYGADTIAGMHCEPATMFSEEYQVELIRLTNEVFDRYPHVIGEHLWNFADFATKQGLTRIGGNKRHLHRNRQPKMSAHHVRERWLAQQAAE